MTLADIDDTDLELLLDMEILDSKICVEADLQRSNKGTRRGNIKVDYADQFL